MHNNANNSDEVQRLNKRRSISPINDFPEYNHKIHPYYEINLVKAQHFQYEPLDLTRRDSVETRRTTSPTNTSGSEELSPSRSNLISITTTTTNQRQTNSQQKIISSKPYNNNNNFPMPTVDRLAIVVASPKQEPMSPPPENGHPQYSVATAAVATTPETNINSTIISSPPKQQMHSPSQSQQSTAEQLAFANFDRYQLEQYKALQLAHLTINREMPATISAMSSLSPLSTISSVSSTAATASSSIPPLAIGPDGKAIRPFKLYPKNPLKFADDSLISRNSEEKYKAYRGEMIEKIYKENGGFATKTNPKMRRISTKTASILSDNDDQKSNGNTNDNLSGSDSVGNKDEAYYERRKKNNAAAKKSRDRRRVKEDELAIRAGYLEQENFELRKSLAASLDRENIAKETIEQMRNQLNNLINKMHNNNNNN